METKRVAILAVFSILLLGGFMFYFLVFTNDQLTGRAVKDNEDGHGCLTHQGYTWNATEHACVLEWISQNQSARYQNGSIPDFNSSPNQTGSNWSTTTLNITEHFENSGLENFTNP